MKKKLLFLSVFLSVVISGFSQFRIETVPPLNGGNGAQGTTFQLTVNSPIILDTLRQAFQAGTQTPEIWYTSTDTVGPPNISTANGWTLVATSPPIVSLGVGTTPAILQTIPIGIGLVLNPGIYRFYVGAATGSSSVYTTWNAANQDVFSDPYITIKTGTNYGYGGTIPSPVNHPRQWNGGFVYSVLGGSNDAAVLSIDSPRVYCSGAQPVVATIANFGVNQIDSVNVTWEVNGVVQGTIPVYTLLDTLNGLSSNTLQVNLGSFTFPQGLNDVRVWTSMPNGVVDTSNFNDTVSVKTGPALNGTFTINATLPASSTNYTSFTSLSTAINTFGVCGPVLVNVAPGTYNESFQLNNVNGASSANTITIDGADSSMVTLTHDGSVSYGTVSIVGTDYVTIRNMRIEATGASSGATVLMSNDASHTTIENNELWANPNTTNSLMVNVTISGSSTTRSTNGIGSHNITRNNKMTGGYYGFYYYGAAISDGNVGNVIDNNQMDSIYYYGVFCYYQDSLVVTNNHVDQAIRGQINGDGLFLYYSNNFIISGNYVHAQDYGLYFLNTSTLTATPTKTRKNVVSNNMVISETDWGVYFQYTDSVNFFYNSVASYGTVNPAVQVTANTTNFPTDYDFRNNVLYAASTEALELNATTDSIFNKFDNNVYYSGGANLFNIGGTTYADLAAYQLAQPAFNSASLDGDPQFLSATDLHIIGAFINGAGDNSVPIFVDIDGDTRPIAGSTTVDPGADEFNPPLCPPPANLTTYNPSLDSVTIAWDGAGNDYQYNVVLAGTPQGGGVSGITSLDSLRIGGLTASTSYDLYVREICGRGDTSVWIGPTGFNTANGVPYLENFELFGVGITGNPWPNGWSSTTTANPKWESEDASGANENSLSTGPFFDNTQFGTVGGMYIYLETSGGAGNIADLVSPPIYIDPSMSTISLEFAYHMYGATMGTLEVLLDTNGVENSITTITGQQQSAGSDPWIVSLSAISGYQGKSVQIIFRGTSGTSYTSDMSIDDVKLDVLPPVTAGITEVISPQLPICPGTVAPVVGVRNSGTDTLTTVTVVYDVNGATDSVIYTGTIFPGDTANVTLGNVTFANGIIYDFLVYTNNPNNVADANNSDDTLSFAGLRTGLSGNFTIDAGSPVSSSNFQSFTDFASAVNNFGLCGSMVVDVVANSGPYNEQVLFDGIDGSSATNSITINGNGNTIAFASANTNQRAVITIENSSYITIDSLIVDADGGTYGWGIQNGNGAHHISILNCDVLSSTTSTSTFFSGIVNSGSRTSATGEGDMNNITIDNCTIEGGYYSITVAGSTSGNSPNFVITNNSIEDFYLYGVYTLRIDNSLVEGNEISRATRTSVSTFYGLFGSTNTNTVMNANIVHDNSTASTTSTSAAYPIYITGDATVGNENYVTNNLVYNINSNGTIYGIYDLGSDGTYYYNNTISLDDTAATAGITRGFYQSALSSNSAFINNIINVSRGGSGVKHGIYLNATTTTMNVDYNDVYMNSAGAGAQSYGYFGADQATLADWQTASTYGANSFEVTPNFVNSAIGDYTPQQALINAVGLSVPQVTSDLFGIARGSNPDFGAIEFDPPPVDNIGLNALVAPFESNDSCYGTTQDVIVELLNAGGTVIDFTNSVTDITINVTGTITQTLTATVNSNAANGGNPLALGASVNINLGTINMSTAGVYNFDGYIVTVNDSLRFNDTLNQVVTTLAPAGGTIAGSDTICSGDTVTLSTSNSIGELQWQVLNAGTWTDIVNATGGSVDVTPTVLTQYRVLACGTAPSDTITVTPLMVASPVAFGDTVIVMCGDSGTASGYIFMPDTSLTYTWYDAAVGGNEIVNGNGITVSADGDSISFTATPAGTTLPNNYTAWVSAATNGGSGGPSLVITEMDLGAPDALEIQNVSNRTIDVTGWTVAISNSYTDINNVNTITQSLSGLMTPGQTMYWTDATATNYWGNNILWNPGAFPGFAGWILVIDNNGNIVDFIAQGWLAADIAGMSVVINGFTITPGLSGAWVGDGVSGVGLPTGSSLYRQGNADNNDATDFIQNVINLGTTNTGLTLPFAGGGCESSRVLVNLRVECLVGLDVLSEETASLSIFPNPSNGLFTLNIETPQQEQFNMTVRDLNGKVVYAENLNVSGTYRSDLDFTSFAKGVYYMQIQTETESKVEKLVIQ